LAFQNVHAGVGGGIRTQISSASDTLPTVWAIPVQNYCTYKFTGDN
jgi:hypothetical protein